MTRSLDELFHYQLHVYNMIRIACKFLTQCSCKFPGVFLRLKNVRYTFKVHPIASKLSQQWAGYSIFGGK